MSLIRLVYFGSFMVVPYIGDEQCLKLFRNEGFMQPNRKRPRIIHDTELARNALRKVGFFRSSVLSVLSCGRREASHDLRNSRHVCRRPQKLAEFLG